MACPRIGCRFQIFPQKPTETQINKSLLRWIWNPILIILQRKNNPIIDQSSWLTILWLILWILKNPYPPRKKNNKWYKIWCHPINFTAQGFFFIRGPRGSTPPLWTAGSNDRPLRSGHRMVFLTPAVLPSDKHTKNYGKSPCSMGKFTINGHFQ